MIVRDLLIKLGFKTDLAPMDKTERKINHVTSALATMAGQLAAMGIAKLASEIHAATEEAMQFAEVMGKIQSLIPDDPLRANEWKKSIQGMAVQFGKSSKDLGEGAYDLISTFGDSVEGAKMLEIATKAGAAGAATTKDGISLLASVTKAYGDTSLQTAQKVADLGFQTVNLGKVELPELAAVMGRATPLASTLGVKMEELFAVMASSTGVTGNGAEVATQMASAMRALADRTKQGDAAFKKAFRHTGIKNIQQAIGQYGLVGTLKKLIDTTDGSTEAVSQLFGRAEALTLALQLTGKGAQDFKNKLYAMQTVAGATDTAFRNQTGGLAANAFALKQAKERTEQMRLEFGDNLLPVMGRVENVTQQVYAAFNEQLLPMLQDPTFLTFGSDVDAINLSMEALRFTVSMLANGLDFVVTNMQNLASAAKFLEGAGDLFNGETDEDVRRKFSAVSAEMDANTMAMFKRLKDRAEYATTGTNAPMLARQAEQARQETSLRRAKRSKDFEAPYKKLDSLIGGGATLNNNVGDVTINVQVPDATSASAAARLGDTGARIMLGSFGKLAEGLFGTGAPAVPGAGA